MITAGPSGTVTTPNVTFSFRANQPATFQCQLDGGALAPCSSPFSAGPLALGMHTFTVQGTDIPGNHNSVSRSFTIAAAPPGGGAPSITNVTQSHRIWRRGSKRASFARKRKPPIGTTFSFKLNEQANLTFAFTQRVRGRKVKRGCVARTTKNRHKPSCRRTMTRGKLSFSGHSGTNKVSFQGRTSRSHELALGPYTLIITATNAAGQRSKPLQITFTIVR